MHLYIRLLEHLRVEVASHKVRDPREQDGSHDAFQLNPIQCEHQEVAMTESHLRD